MMKIENSITRKCVYTNQILPIDSLLRINKDKNNIIKVDWNLQLKGRGAYLIKDKNIILQALSKKIINKAFRMNVDKTIYNEIIKEVENYGW
ncbi:YlxR family protein [Mycoplasma phocimorsus]|uniref:YlxR family protein n=2 Tax=Mycoplasma phocimorsus TaxID=3045839 RepID=A0AAJ1UWQ0_9MOLU|nr:YlxR family protein [Mycoplasma phocimorsus]MDJ1645867.1 YlxR family protein [Mycoplasma phocimorsus]MDJ1647034.1 YlxR family protein [Mycoplasma phocimorsus]MDJ1647475.1 YlxR family protein [Mycoplasma phocimorsus]MDJ1647987.1 YlxR family protein [Mycoplasma phocimorsus]MDJ1649106.1 YlxR family protein [Mycoplasma phocimorsus]